MKMTTMATMRMMVVGVDIMLLLGSRVVMAFGVVRTRWSTPKVGKVRHGIRVWQVPERNAVSDIFSVAKIRFFPHIFERKNIFFCNVL